MLPAKVLRRRLGRREQQVRFGIDPSAILFFWPGLPQIMASQPGFDMSERNLRGDRRQRTRHRTRGVALHDHQVRPPPKEREQGIEHLANVRVRIHASGATEGEGRKAVQPGAQKVEVRMLSGEDEGWRQPALAERLSDGSQLDGFGAGTDDQPDVRAVQPSP
jgi:hypothetical protein